MVRAIVDTRMLSRLKGFYPSLCTIQQATTARDSQGGQTQTWAAVAGYSDIPCAVAPFSQGQPVDHEVRQGDETYAVASHHIALRGYCPAITVLMRAVVSGVAWNILGVEHDSHGVTTRLKVERVS